MKCMLLTDVKDGGQERKFSLKTRAFFFFLCVAEPVSCLFQSMTQEKACNGKPFVATSENMDFRVKSPRTVHTMSSLKIREAGELQITLL